MTQDTSDDSESKAPDADDMIDRVDWILPPCSQFHDMKDPWRVDTPPRAPNSGVRGTIPRIVNTEFRGGILPNSACTTHSRRTKMRQDVDRTAGAAESLD